MLAHDEWLAEFKAVIKRPLIRNRLVKHEIGYLINRIHSDALWLPKIADVDRSSDPKDNYLLGMAVNGQADYLITGDKTGLLALGAHGPTRILTASAFIDRLAAT